ncbi:MarR family transcriptional regulator [Saprospiraceae bacterium]|nr:MarR family transcriptional regulator [Saprospiraceae bacterium]
MIANIFRKHLKEFDITDSQLSILFFVTKSQNVNQKSISDFLISEKSTVNRNLKRLTDKGLISFNKRHLDTTREGKQLLERIIPSWNHAMKEVKEIIGDEGEIALDTMYSKLKGHIC